MFYSQLDFPEVLLGNSPSVTLAEGGCGVVSFANGLGSDPVEMNEFLKKENCFSGIVNGQDQRAWLIYSRIAESFQVAYEKTTEKPSQVCIAETLDTSAPQHFFLYNPENNMMVDPLNTNPEWEECTYTIESYRVFDGLFEGVFDEEVLDTQEQNIFQIIQRLARNAEFSNDTEQKKRICKEIAEKAWEARDVL